MKRLAFTFIITVTVILAVVSAFYNFLWYQWFSSRLHAHLDPLTTESTRTLIESIANDPHRKRLKSTLDKYTARTCVNASVFLADKGDVVYSYAARNDRHPAVFFSSEYPVVRGEKTIGRVVLAPDLEFVLNVLFQGRHTAAFVVWLAGWWFAVMAALYVYLKRNLLAPLIDVKRFVLGIEKDDFVTLKLSSRHREWKQFSNLLNTLRDQLSGTAQTLRIFLSLSQTLTAHKDRNEIYGMILDAAREKCPDASPFIVLMYEDGFLRVNAQRDLSPDFAKAVHFRPGEDVPGDAYQKCEAVVVQDAAEENSPLIAAARDREGLASYAYLPVCVDSVCIGLLGVNSCTLGYFNRERIKFFTALASYLSIASRNDRLYEQIQELNCRLETEVSTTTRELIQTNSRLIQKVREMKALSDIASFAAAKVNLSEILEMIVDKVKELLSAQAAGFFLYSPETNDVIPCPPFFGIRDREFSRLRFNLSEVKVLESALREGKQYILNTPAQVHESLPLLANLLSIHTLVLVPLRSGKKPIGIMGVANKFGAPFTADDLRILELIADRISGIIDNVTLYQELQLRLHDLTALQEISSAISSEPVWEKTLKKIISGTTQAFSADLCALLLYDEKTNELVTQAGAYFTGGDEAVLQRIALDDPNSHSAQVFRSGEPFLSPDALIDPRIKSQTSRLWDVRSLILVPLRAENRVIGVLRIGKHQANFYTKDHLRLAALIAHQAAIIIENAHLYDSLREAKLELEKLNQVKNEFISIVSHELRTPITTIKGFVKIVLQGEAGALGAQQEKFLRIADQATDRLTILISDLLDISRIESGQMSLNLSPVDARELIDQVEHHMAPEAARKQLRFACELPEKLPLIMADRDRIRQVFDNLILNSMKFTPEGGSITLSAIDKGDYVLFGITDTGIGIDRKEHEKIFEKFYQVDSGPTRAATGAGLGLAIVKSIVEIHGGRIWVESEPGQGSTFKFIVPRARTEIQDFRREDGAEARDGSRDAVQHKKSTE